MPQHLQLERPLAVLDLETTGLDVKKDRIVEIGIIKIDPSGERISKCRRLNPEMPIPAAATKIHGIGDADVAEMPTFSKVAKGLAEFLSGCDLCGFNILNYDLPMLTCEFHRVSVPFDLNGRHVLDAQSLYHKLHPRDLTAAVREYLGREHSKAHSAEADTNATFDVLEAMLGRHENLTRTIPGLIIEQGNRGFLIDSGGVLRNVMGEIRFAVGKHRGQPLGAVLRNDPSYLDWATNKSDYPTDTKAIIHAEVAKVKG